MAKHSCGVVRWTKADGLMPEAIEVARKRTRNLLLSWHLMDHDITILLTSAYLQGVRDTAEAVAREDARNAF